MGFRVLVRFVIVFFCRNLWVNGVLRLEVIVFLFFFGLVRFVFLVCGCFVYFSFFLGIYWFLF